MAIKIRNIPGQSIVDPSTLENLQYNNSAGSKKTSEVGRHLLPINTDGATYSTNMSGTPQVLPSQGRNLAVYNNSGSLGSVTLGEDATLVSLAPGATDANGHVGIPCKPNDWTYIACAGSQWVISSAATLLVFLIDDDSSIKQEAVR